MANPNTPPATAATQDDLELSQDLQDFLDFLNSPEPEVDDTLDPVLQDLLDALNSDD